MTRENAFEELIRHMCHNKQPCLNALQVAGRLNPYLNKQTDRMFKSKVVDQTYAEEFGMSYKDKKGYDLLFRDCWRISHKAQKTAFCKTKKRTREIALVNTQSKHLKANRNQDFDFLLITQTSAPLSIALCTYEAAMKNSWFTSDQIKTRIDYENLVFIVDPNEKIEFSDKKFNIQSLIMALSKRIREMCKD